MHCLANFRRLKQHRPRQPDHLFGPRRVLQAEVQIAERNNVLNDLPEDRWPLRQFLHLLHGHMRKISAFGHFAGPVVRSRRQSLTDTYKVSTANTPEKHHTPQVLGHQGTGSGAVFSTNLRQIG